MKMSIVILALLSIVALAVCQNDAQVYCGRRLATAIALFCNGNLIKRSVIYYGNSLDEASWPWMPSHRAHSLGRHKRGVVAECCEKPCKIEELLSYCGDD
ncbi:unnamed protein product [Euphydryas editha]|uniref:Insulin-like domain-containing protein n=1 Tax=Euphydryas editha TaxID=104508 RepID=A0AAU9UF14_EUPED|nr:unnamed protein product [Euphydryas editha]